MKGELKEGAKRPLFWLILLLNLGWIPQFLEVTDYRDFLFTLGSWAVFNIVMAVIYNLTRKRAR